MKWLLAALLCVCLGALHSQNALRFEAGRSFIGETFPGQTYDVWLFTAGAAFPISRNDKNTRLNGIVGLHYADGSTITNGHHDFDVAMNLTFELVLKIFGSGGVLFSIGSGPSYQSSESIVQAKGFIFSNNISTGLSIPIGQVKIVPSVRFRHLSNARTKSPNQGIDNFVAVVGMEIPLR